LVFGAQAGSPTTGLSRLKFTTKEVEYADLDFELSIEKYYDGSELAKLNPDYEAYSGYVVAPVTATVDNNAVAFYFSYMYALDYPYYTYEQLIEGLLADGEVEELTSYYVFEFDTTYTFFGVAEDVNGNFTKVWASKDTTFKRENCAPAEEYFSSASKSGFDASKKRALRSTNGLLSL
jgi:hypothetical protein